VQVSVPSGLATGGSAEIAWPSSWPSSPGHQPELWCFPADREWRRAVLARSRRWPNDIGLGRELTRLVRLGTVVAEVVPNPRRPGEGGGRLIALDIVEGRPPVVHHRAKTGLISFAGVVEGSDACGGVVLTELVITCADCSIRSYLKEGGAAGALADEAVQAQGKLTAPMEVMGDELRTRTVVTSTDRSTSRSWHGPRAYISSAPPRSVSSSGCRRRRCASRTP
jgi:hypothetical protein